MRGERKAPRVRKVRNVTRFAGALFGLAAALSGATACAGSPTPAATAAAPRPIPAGSSGVRNVETQAAAAPYPGHCDAPAVIAHRGETGDGSRLPENTWQAELAASAAGATYLNMDVRWTRDGIPVALHDATVNRTTSETRPNTLITDLTAQQYVSLDARTYATDTTAGRIDPSIHPDTLAEALAKIATTGKPIVLQMEADPFAGRRPVASAIRDFAAFAEVIQHSNYADRVIVAGWTTADLRAFHAIAPNVRLAYLVETIGMKNTPAARQILATGAHIIYVDFRGVTASEVTAWRAAGLKVWTWTPADRTEWERLRTDGVEAIATNWTTYYLRWAPVPCAADPSLS